MLQSRALSRVQDVIVNFAATVACLSFVVFFSGPVHGAEGVAPPWPVILLNGFEPFGSNRPPNPSWEEIKDLDGSVWHGYRCEGTLYSLEYLRQTRTPAMSVMFSHVPSLDSKGESPASMREFVPEVLVAWNDSGAEGAGSASDRGETDSRDKEVRRFIETYFRTWSAGEMDKYAACFHPEAVIQFIDKGQIRTQLAPQFLAEQRRYQGQSKSVEMPLSAEVRFEEMLARAVVRWKLLGSGGRTKYGYDHFTLIPQEGGWKIVNLVFYETKSP